MDKPFHLLEILPVIIYLGVLLVLGFSGRGRSADEESFIVDGRRLTLPAFVATLVTTWYGGILGVGEFTFRYGLSNWIVFGLPYYLFAVLFAFFLAPKIRASGMLSIPDQFYRHYGKWGGRLGAVFTFFMTLPAPYLLMVGLLLHFLTGWNMAVCLLLSAVFSMGYVLSGGFRAVVRTDKLQFLLMFGGFLLLLIVLMSRFGGLSFLKTHLPPLHLTWHGGNSPEYILVWFFIALWTFIDPGFHQRCYAAKTSAVARRGILVSVGFWLLFDLLTTSSGLYARALLSGDSVQAALSFPLIGHAYLPPLLSGLFLAGLFATIMSTVDSFALLSAITIGHDLLRRRSTTAKESLRYLQAGLLLSAVLSVALALLIPSVINLWLVLGMIFIPPMLLPLLACYYPALQPGKSWVLANLLLAFAVSLCFLIVDFLNSPSPGELTFAAGLPPMYPGLAISIVIFSVGALLRRRVRR